MTDEQLKAIGCVTVESAHLESLLDDFIQTICRFTDEQRKLFIGNWSIGIKIEAIKALVQPKLRSKIKLKKFDALFKNMTDLINRRNAISHANWTTSKPINWLGVTLDRSSRNFDAIAVGKKKKLSIKANDFMDIALRIHESRLELYDFFLGVIVVKKRRTWSKKSP